MSHGVIRDGVYFKQEKEKDKLRMGGSSWSINMDELAEKDVHTYVYCTEKAHYIISTLDANEHGFMRILGGERKLVVPVKFWKEQTKEQTNDSPRKT